MKRKIFLFLMLFLISNSKIFSQDIQKYDKDRNYFFIGGGFAVNTFSHNGLDYVIDRYNETRQGKPGQFRLTQNMDKIHSMFGYEVGFGWVSNKYDNGLFYTMNFQRTSGTSHGEGYTPLDTLNLNLQTRDLKASLDNFAMGIGLIPIQTPVLDIGFGMQMNMPILNFYTSLNSGSYEKIEYVDQIGFGGGFYMLFNFFLFKGFPLNLSAQPYYFFDFIPSDMSGLSEEINPATYTNDEEKKLKGKMSQFGLQVQANICIFARKQKGSNRIDRDKNKKKRDTKGFSLL
jgi:hypothetical protein